jgi:hypothetical protein
MRKEGRMIDRKVLAVVFVLLMAVAVSQAQDQQQKAAAGAKAKSGKTTTDKGPTLDETMNWIVNSLSVTTPYYYHLPDIHVILSHRYQYTLTKAGMCSLRVVTQYSVTENPGSTQSSTESSPTTDYNVNLAELDPTSAAVKPVVLPGDSPKSQNPFQLTVSKTNTSTSGFGLVLSDESLANRGKVALVHTIELCGGKKSAF